MRYYATSVSPYQQVEFSWSDFETTKQFIDLKCHPALSFTLLAGCVIFSDKGHGVNYSVAQMADDALHMAFFMTYSSKYADYDAWTKVRAWFKTLEPSEKACLVKARQWFQGGCRLNSSRGNVKTFGSFVLSDLNRGTVVVATHVDHSDC